ncbi:MAG: AMP-binding protein [Promethearchaeota archaeon]
MKNLFIGLTRYIEQNPEPRLKGMFCLFVSGAGLLHEPVKKKFEAISGGRLVEAYDLTECTTTVSAGPFNGKDEPRTIGLSNPGTDWLIFDMEDFDKAPLEGFVPEYTGEICVSVSQVFKGYLNSPEATAETLREWDGKI